VEDDIEYCTPPPRRSFVVGVRYQFIGTGKPMVFPLDEVGGEP
jgi:hypothetical protein